MKPTTVTIRKTSHATKPYTVVVHPPGKKPAYTIMEGKKAKRYARPFTAKRGAARHLGGYIHRQWDHTVYKYRTLGYKMQNGSPIVFK